MSLQHCIARYGSGYSGKRWVLFLALLVLCPLTTVAQSVQPQDFSALKSHLESLGWQVERSPGGDLILRPRRQGSKPMPVISDNNSVLPARSPAPEGTATAPTEGSPAPSKSSVIPATDIDTLSARLEGQGWRVRRDSSGALLLYPKVPVASPERAEAVTNGDAAPQQSQDELQALLSASGWRVEKSATGDLTLFPGGEEPQTAKATRLIVRQGDLAGARAALTAAGWRLGEAGDGSLLLYPRRGAGEQGGGAVSGPAGIDDPVVTGEVDLPIDSWKKAHTLAKFWLEQQNNGSLALGKIRKVNWVYLVSIVEASPPYRLKNQIAIRNLDGRVVPLF